ncbi:hypothetical protein CDL12_13864 [Handroanthus impetiginosus]|uniref:Uncharacterized protein n=1 Tax=Handroanthus impetiginosus TaxID=429701 RepID=A0A2G9H7L2_9LAMI|nr:hypothetical protein CDL12_13864 [Handroanthus impetiginosus]
MEGSGRKYIALLVFVIFLNSFLLVNVEGRVLNGKCHLRGVDSAIEKNLDELHVQAIKTGGPSHGGAGHGATHGLTLEGMKKPGPSAPGEGH